jgi:DNA topoisomerase IA
MAAPREVSEPLVQAYLARRALDYLVGFTLSPLLWRKVPGCRSAGRVQSVALRLVCEREKEYERFVPQEFWTVHATLQVHSLLVPRVSTSACHMATFGRAGEREAGGWAAMLQRGI